VRATGRTRVVPRSTLEGSGGRRGAIAIATPPPPARADWLLLLLLPDHFLLESFSLPSRKGFSRRPGSGAIPSVHGTSWKTAGLTRPAGRVKECTRSARPPRRVHFREGRSRRPASRRANPDHPSHGLRGEGM
jgi:hypothetical protein